MRLHVQRFMNHELLVTVVCGVSYLVAGFAVYLHIRGQVWWANPVSRVAAAAAIGLNLAYLGRAIALEGLVSTFEHSFDAIVLLSTLIGLVALGTHLAPRLRGLDGLLFLAAGVVAFSAIFVLRQPSGVMSARPWFISHSLAFAVSGVFFIAGGVAGIAYLLVNWMLRRKRLALVRKVPPLESLERFGRWMPIIGFPVFTYGILTGLCGVAHRPDFATVWYRDPTFLFAIAAWLIYAYMTASLMYRPRIRGRRAATLATYGLGLVIVIFLAREFLSPLHQ